MQSPISDVDKWVSTRPLLIRMAYLRVQKPPETTLLTGFFPAPNTDEHECKQGRVRDKGGEGGNLGVFCMLHRT